MGYEETYIPSDPITEFIGLSDCPSSYSGKSGSVPVVNAGASGLEFDPIMPIGSIVAWAKTLTGVPALSARWVECAGQTLSDGESPLNGQTIPDLNGGNRFMRGNSTSGATGGAATHDHEISGQSWNREGSNGGGTVVVYTGSGGVANTQGATTSARDTGSESSLPPYYDVVYIMRVK